MSFVSIPDLIAISISLVALAIAILAYKLSLKQPNENKIYDEKIQCYLAIIKVFNNTLNVIYYNIEECIEIRKEKESDWEEHLVELEEGINEAISQVDDVFNETSLLVPSDIADRLTAISDLLDRDDFIEEYTTMKKLDKLSDELNKEFDDLVDKLRQDIAFEKLDTGLRARIKAHKEN